MIFSLNGRMNVKMFGCVSYKKGYWHKGRTVANHLLVYLIAGTLTMRIGKKSYPAEAGDLLFIPKDTPYKPEESSGCTYYFFHFKAEETEREKKGMLAVPALANDCEGFSYMLGNKNQCTVKLDALSTPQNRPSIEKLLLRASRLDLVHDPRQKAFLDLYFRELLTKLSPTEEADLQMSDTLQRIVSYIIENIRIPLSLHSISSYFYLSESYISRLFKRELGESVGAYIVKQKIALSCALLLNSDMSIAEIAEHIGFSSPYYFSNVFKKQKGMTPTAYRKK